MAYHSYFLILILAVLGSNFGKCAEFVPVYMWGTNKLSEHVPALHKISQDSFKDTLLEYFKKDPCVIVFAERTLSPEDFAQRGQNGASAFTNIQQLKDEGNFVSYRSNVQNPIEAIKQVKPVTQISISSILSSINVPKENVWIINLDDAKDDETRFHMLKRHDFDIVSIYKDLLKQRDNVLALYTANHTAWVAPEDVTRSRSRNLLQDDPTPAPPQIIHFDAQNITIYLTANGQYSHDGGQPEEITNAATLSSEGNGTEFTATLTFGSTDIKFQITSKIGYWYINKITVGTEDLVAKNAYYAPLGFSYHCGAFNLTNSRKTMWLSLPGFQVQAFVSNFTRFGDAYDCVGFTSVPIWSGLFVTAIMLLIMTFGLTMMMDIKTMDRFDDPKGKTITVTASE